MRTQLVPGSRIARLPRTARRGRSAPSSRLAPARLQELPCATPRGKFGGQSRSGPRMHPNAIKHEHKNAALSGRSARRMSSTPAAAQRAWLSSSSRRAAFGEAMPNTSLKLSANGVAHWPSGAGPAAHFALAVQRAMPSSPA